MIIVDVWGGVNSQIWEARFIRNMKEALQIAEIELMKGFLVNLLQREISDGDVEFDKRAVQ